MLNPTNTPLAPDTFARRVGDRVWLITSDGERLQHWPLSFDLVNLDLLELAAELVIAYAARYPQRLDDVLAKLRRAIAVAPFSPNVPTTAGHELGSYLPRDG